MEETEDSTGDKSGNASSSMLSMVMLRAGVAALRADEAAAATFFTGAGSGDGDLTAAATGTGADTAAEVTTAGLAFATCRMGGDGSFFSDEVGEEAAGEELRGLRLVTLAGGDGSVGRSSD